MPLEPAVADPLHTALAHAFAPMHKRALGVATAVVAGGAILLLTAFHVVFAPLEGANIALLSHYFYGYEVTWTGALVGAWWAGVVGFVAGWFFAFVRNFSLATWLLIIRARSELFAARDFLDHI